MLKYNFEKMVGGAFKVRLKGEFVCYVIEKDSSKVDKILTDAGFINRQDFLDFCGR